MDWIRTSNRNRRSGGNKLKTIEKFWNDFLENKGLSSETKYIDAFHFCHTEELANALLELVLQGKKKATCSAYLGYASENDIPKIGSYSIVTNFAGEPFAIIQTTNVTILPLNKVTWEMAKREGEDEIMDTWIEGHCKYFKQEAEEEGFAYSEDMPIVFEDFEVIYKRSAEFEH